MDVITINEINQTVLQIGNVYLWDIELHDDETWQPELHATVMYPNDEVKRAAINRKWCKENAAKTDYLDLLKTANQLATNHRLK
ncbi:hypothetical protein [Pseudescherichia sp.]|uniref:hypothetical protein n=1 Tax=Pseudescherichia sp. TaxID=2055881 RepID=UPI0028A95013|nr:hypothetical protein [Pseudescherichia sp.]